MFQATEKKRKRIITLDMNNPEHLEITKITRILKPEEIVRMSLSPVVHDRRKELIRMFPETRTYEVPLEQRRTWNTYEMVGDLVRNLLQTGNQL